MVKYTPDFTLEVEGVRGVCPAGEVYALILPTLLLVPKHLIATSDGQTP